MASNLLVWKGYQLFGANHSALYLTESQSHSLAFSYIVLTLIISCNNFRTPPPPSTNLKIYLADKYY